MITRATAAKAVIFVLLTAALVLYIGARFLGLFGFVGARDYTVHLPLADANGLFERSEVTFRGAKVGAVGPLRLTDQGVVADLIIEGGAPRVPADLKALVADRSAVGERYVDLRPNTDNGPFLKDGDTIPADRVAVPVAVHEVLGSLDALAASVPLGDLQTSVRELGVAFNGLGPKLQLLLDSTDSLTASAMDNLPQTLALIRDARTVLKTQNDLADPIKSFSSDLKLVAGQLKDSDGDIRRLLDTGPDAAREVSALLDESGDGLAGTIEHGLTLSHVLRDNLRNVQSILQLYPGLAAAVPTIIPGDGTAHLGLVINFDNPPNCWRGYEKTFKRPGTDISAKPVNWRAFCREPLYDPTDVRGVKPGYPFKNDKPTPAPDWFHAFYQNGPAAGIYDPIRIGGKDGDKVPASKGGNGQAGDTNPAAFGN